MTGEERNARRSNELAKAEPVYSWDEPRDARIVAWRITCFEGLGFASLQASVLASRRDVDREYVERLRRRGATPAQVMAIVL